MLFGCLCKKYIIPVGQLNSLYLLLQVIVSEKDSTAASGSDSILENTFCHPLAQPDAFVFIEVLGKLIFLHI